MIDETPINAIMFKYAPAYLHSNHLHIGGNLMELSVLILVAVGLSMDAFAVAVCKGLCMPKINRTYTFLIGLFFGGFQALMPLIGWILGKQFESYITDYDHWIAFVLLALIGGNMVYEAVKNEDDEEACPVIRVNFKELFLLAVATSIDALAVGVTFAFLKANIWISILLIGCITFIISIAGVLIGHKFGIKFKQKAELAGGIILIMIGLKILLEHLGVLNL